MADDRDTDRGWAWVILALSTVCRVIEAHVVISVGLFQMEFLKHFSGSIGFTSLLSSVFMSLELMTGPLSSLLCNIFSIRTAMMTGGCLFALGLISSCFVTNLTQLFITFSIIAGFGFGLAYTPMNVIIGHYFYNLRSVANGASTSAAGIGFAIGPFINIWLLENYGWRLTLAVLGGCALQFCVLAAASFPSKSEIASRKRTSSSKLSGSVKLSSFWFLGHPHWWIFCLNYGFQMIAWSIQVVHFPSFAESRGVSLEDLNSMFVAFGIVVGTSRMLCGFLCNDDSVDPLAVLIGIQGMQALVTIFMPLYGNSFAGLFTYQILLSLFFGAAFVPITPLAVHLFGVPRLATVFGSVMMWGGIGALFGPVLAGLLYDASKSYALGFYISGLVVMTGSFVLLLIPLMKVKDDLKVKDKADSLHHENMTLIIEEKNTPLA